MFSRTQRKKDVQDENQSGRKGEPLVSEPAPLTDVSKGTFKEKNKNVHQIKNISRDFPEILQIVCTARQILAFKTLDILTVFFDKHLRF